MAKIKINEFKGKKADIDELFDTINPTQTVIDKLTAIDTKDIRSFGVLLFNEEIITLEILSNSQKQNVIDAILAELQVQLESAQTEVETVLSNIIEED